MDGGKDPLAELMEEYQHAQAEYNRLVDDLDKMEGWTYQRHAPSRIAQLPSLRDRMSQIWEQLSQEAKDTLSPPPK